MKDGLDSRRFRFFETGNGSFSKFKNFSEFQRYQMRNHIIKQKFAKKAHNTKYIKIDSLVPLTDD